MKACDVEPVPLRSEPGSSSPKAQVFLERTNVMEDESDRTDRVWYLSWSRGRAALLSVVAPGCGQLYSGKTVAAIIWLPAVIFAYLASPSLGLVAHGICVFDATERDRRGVFEDLRDARISKRGTCVFGAMVFLLLVIALCLALWRPEL